MPAPIVNGKEIAAENGRISNFEGIVTLTLDRVILHTVVHISSTCTYMPSFIKIDKTVCGRTDVHTDGHTVPSSKSRDTRTRPNIENLAQTNLDIVP